MPLLLIGALVGGGTVWVASDKAASLVKWAAIGGAAFVGYKLLVKRWSLISRQPSPLC